jgi:asparagine synthase (glutamine-hydrolysing)
MCGIAGFIDQSSNKKEAENVIGEMLLAIKHRGPDHSGYKIYEDGVVLGHNRLSIIDLSEVGNQPFDYKHLSITYNGEIYNYKEIRKELEELGHRFRSETDTEVILAAFDEWGEKCVERFLGMWAFAIWDKEKRMLFCSRDRFGIKPFYYFIKNSRFYFASEVKSLKKSAHFPLEISEDMTNLYLHLGWHTYKDQTIYSGIMQIESGCNLMISKDLKVRINKYWDIDLTKPKLNISLDDAIAGYKSLFENSIDLHMRSDVPVGATLSGGIDSSSIVSMIAKRNPNYHLKTFSIYYSTEKNMDERPFIKELGKKYKNVESFYKEPSEQEIFDELEKILSFQDFPLLGSSFISQYFVMKLAKENGMKVLLDGQGADEYLVGYLRSFYRIVGQKFGSREGWEIFKTHIQREGYDLKEILSRFGKTVLSSLVTDQKMLEIEYLYKQPYFGLNKKIPFQVKEQKGEKLNEFLYNLLFYSELPRLLHYADLNSMHFSIESRVPFLDHRLVEFMFKIPDDYKIKGGITKYILRESCKDVLPEQIYERKDKKGFVTPGEVRWINNIKGSHEFERNSKIGKENGKLVWRKYFLEKWVH